MTPSQNWRFTSIKIEIAWVINNRYREREALHLKEGVFLNILNQLYHFPGSRLGVEDV